MRVCVRAKVGHRNADRGAQMTWSRGTFHRTAHTGLDYVTKRTPVRQLAKLQRASHIDHTALRYIISFSSAGRVAALAGVTTTLLILPGFVDVTPLTCVQNAACVARARAPCKWHRRYHSTKP